MARPPWPAGRPELHPRPSTNGFEFGFSHHLNQSMTNSRQQHTVREPAEAQPSGSSPDRTTAQKKHHRARLAGWTSLAGAVPLQQAASAAPSGQGVAMEIHRAGMPLPKECYEFPVHASRTAAPWPRLRGCSCPTGRPLGESTPKFPRSEGGWTAFPRRRQRRKGARFARPCGCARDHGRGMFGDIARQNILIPGEDPGPSRPDGSCPRESIYAELHESFDDHRAERRSAPRVRDRCSPSAADARHPRHPADPARTRAMRDAADKNPRRGRASDGRLSRGSTNGWSTCRSISARPTRDRAADPHLRREGREGAPGRHPGKSSSDRGETRCPPPTGGGDPRPRCRARRAKRGE